MVARRPRPSSLRAQILSRTLLVGLVPLAVLAIVALVSLQRLHLRSDQGIADARLAVAEGGDAAAATQAELEALDREIDDLRRELSLVVLVVLVFAGFVAVAVAALLNKRIVIPISQLTERVRWVAAEGLPEAVHDTFERQRTETPQIDTNAIEADDELGDLARSLDWMQQTAIRLAEEQATHRRNTLEMFANLGRRNQLLVARQLRFIDELEQSEDDPARLASLYKLDHLATRMRRSAESFLVISGHRPPSPRAAPVRMELVVEGALGEVEAYERVETTSITPASLRSHAVTDVAHLAAELIENALSFSPPESIVQVSGDRGALYYTLRIFDRGTGLSESDLVAVNERLRAPVDIYSQPTSHLGLTVVERLASPHEISVRLHRRAEGGIEAQVEIPNRLIEAPGAALTRAERTDVDTLQLRRIAPDPPHSELAPEVDSTRYRGKSSPHPVAPVAPRPEPVVRSEESQSNDQ